MYEKQDYECAIDNLKRTIELNSKDYDAYIIYAKILTKMNKLEEASEILEMAEEQGANTGDFYYICARLAKLRHETEESNEYLKLALKNFTTLSISPKKVQAEMM